MEDAMMKKPGLTAADRAARIVTHGMKLDEAIINLEKNAKRRVKKRALRLASQPNSSSFSSVLTTAQHYLSPLEGSDEHLWGAYIVLATDIIKENGQIKASYREISSINTQLYDTLGAFMMRLNYPHY